MRIWLDQSKDLVADYDGQLVTPAGINPKDYVEGKLMEGINSKYKHLHVDTVEYVDIKSFFPVFQNIKPAGVVVESFEISATEATDYSNEGCYVSSISPTKMECKRIVLYLYLSSGAERSRTSFASQTLFPAVVDYISYTIDGPSYLFADHPMCFVDMRNKPMTKGMIMKQLTLLHFAGITCIHPMDDTYNPDIVQYDLESIMDFCIPNFTTNAGIYVDTNYEIDFNNKTVKILDSISANLVADGQYVDFNGSTEKFYWIEIIGIVIAAKDLGFSIDISEFEQFITNYQGRFKPNKKKFPRCELLLKHLKKYIE